MKVNMSLLSGSAVAFALVAAVAFVPSSLCSVHSTVSTTVLTPVSAELSAYAMSNGYQGSIDVATLGDFSGAHLHTTFTQEVAGGETRIKVEALGLPPGEYATHVHTWGDMASVINPTTGLSTGTISTNTSIPGSIGGHFNPLGAPHGCTPTEVRHVGDIGNIKILAGVQGFQTFEFTSALIDLAPGPRSIIGRSLVMHSKKDQCTQPAGDSGTPAAQGVIGYKVPAAGQKQLAAPTFPAGTQLVANFVLNDSASKKWIIVGSVRFYKTDLGAYRVLGKFATSAIAPIQSGKFARLHVLQYGEEMEASGQPVILDLGSCVPSTVDGLTTYTFDTMIPLSFNADALAGRQLRFAVGPTQFTTITSSQATCYASIGASFASQTQTSTTKFATGSGEISAHSMGFSFQGTIDPITLGDFSKAELHTTFTQAFPGAETCIHIDAIGLPIGSYATHVHQWGDLTSVINPTTGLTTSSISTNSTGPTTPGIGGHFNPYGATHGCRQNLTRHVGDIGQLDIIQATGTQSFNFRSHLIDLSAGPASVIGRAVVMHSKKDSCQGPAGDAGTPAIQGTIGYQTPTGVTVQMASPQFPKGTQLVASFVARDTSTDRNVIIGNVRFYNTSTGAYRVKARMASTLLTGQVGRLQMLNYGAAVMAPVTYIDLGTAQAVQEGQQTVYTFDCMLTALPSTTADKLVGRILQFSTGMSVSSSQTTYAAAIGASAKNQLESVTSNYVSPQSGMGNKISAARDQLSALACVLTAFCAGVALLL